MSNTKPQDVIAQAVDFLRQHYLERGLDIRRAHAHAAVSHYLGFNSKIALICDSDFDPSDVNLLCYRETSTDKLALHIPLMKPTPLQGLNVHELGAVIYAGLAPACECCVLKSLSITPLGYEESDPDGWVCRPCADDENAGYARCRSCGDHYIYRASEISHRGHCAAHNGESVMIQQSLSPKAQIEAQAALMPVAQMQAVQALLDQTSFKAIQAAIGQPSMIEATLAAIGQTSLSEATLAAIGQPSMIEATLAALGQPSMIEAAQAAIGQTSLSEAVQAAIGQTSWVETVQAAIGQTSLSEAVQAAIGQTSLSEAVQAAIGQNQLTRGSINDFLR